MCPARRLRDLSVNSSMNETNAYLHDVLDQPASVRASIEAADADSLDRIAHEIGAAPSRRIVFTGMGSSHFGALAVATHLAGLGRRVSVVSAAQLLHYELPSIDAETVVVMVSQSGRSAEIVRLIERLPKSVTTVGITNDTDSPLALRSQYVLPMNVAPERSVTTRSYLATLVQASLLGDALCGKDWRAKGAQVAQAIDLLEDETGHYAERTSVLDSFLGVPACVNLIGRGYSLSTVRAGALFVREVAKHPAADFDAGEFRHGPFEMIEPGFVATIFAPEGATHALNCGLARDIAQRGGRAVLVTSAAPPWEDANVLVILQRRPPCESLAPLIDIVPVQLIANSIASAKGYDVGAFRWSSKVTVVE